MIGLSQNSTHRDWTGVGCLNSELEGVVDPAGLITPWLDGFSVDIWLKKGGKLYAPSKLKDVKQSLVQNLPIILTEWDADGAKVSVETLGVRIAGKESVVCK